MAILKFRLMDPPLFPRIEWRKYLNRADVPTIIENWSVYKAGNVVDGSLVKTTSRKMIENALTRVGK